MKWTVTLVAETEPGHVRDQPVAQIEREDTITLASLDKIHSIIAARVVCFEKVKRFVKLRHCIRGHL